MEASRLLIAGGGTGGHLFPGMAVAEEFLSRSPGNRALFVGTAAGMEARLLPAAGYDFAAIRSQGLAGKGLAAKLRGGAILPLSLLDAVRVTRKFRPHVALGVGGYVSGPAILAARLLGVPCAIHEQNTVPGWANRILARLVQTVFVSFDQARPAFPAASRKGRLLVSGNPVRRFIRQALEEGRKRGPAAAPAAKAKVRLFIVGGSQGAHGLNLLALAAVAALEPRVRDRIVIRHQTGEKDREMAAARYRELNVAATVDAFIQDMAGAYLAADLALSRSGAGAVAELALAGRPAILVPFPHAAADHQTANARVLVEAGAALLFPEAQTDGPKLAQAITELVDDPEKMKSMAAKALAAARPDAAAVIVDACLRMASAKTNEVEEGLPADGKRI